MKKLKHNQDGFVTMIVVILLILTSVIVLTYLRVAKAQG